MRSQGHGATHPQRPQTVVLLVAESDPTLAQVVWAHTHCHLVTKDNTNPITTKLSSEMGNHLVTRLGLHKKGPTRVHFLDGSFHLNQVICGHCHLQRGQGNGAVLQGQGSKRQPYQRSRPDTPGRHTRVHTKHRCTLSGSHPLHERKCTVFLIHWLRRRFADPFLLVMVLTQLAILVALFLGSPNGFTADEGELHQPTTGWLMANGYIDLLPTLQYTSFCGGCTVEGVLYAPLSQVFGPLLWVWKLIPWAFSLAILIMGYTLARQLAGFRAARVFGLWMCLGPDWYRYGIMQGFGSHMEVMALVLGSVLLWCQAIHEAGTRWSFLLGLCWGLGFWFCYTSAFVPPVLLLVWYLRASNTFQLRRITMLGIGVGIGLLPWLAIGQLRQAMGMDSNGPSISIYGTGLSGLIGLEHIPRRIGDLIGPAWWESMYNLGLGEFSTLPGIVSSIILMLGILGALQWTRTTRNTRERGPLALATIGLLAAYAGAYVLVEPSVTGNETLTTIPRAPNAMRYLLPTVPLLGLCIAAAWEEAQQRGRRHVWGRLIAAVLLLGSGALSTGHMLLDRQPSLRPMHLLALDMKGTAERIAIFARPGPSIEAVLGRSPGEGWLRKFHLQALGSASARAMVNNNNRAWADWIASMPPADRHAFLNGLADGLHRQQIVYLEAETFPGLAVENATQHLTPESRCSLYRYLIRSNPGPALEALRAQPAGQPIRALAQASPCERAALAWAWGRAAADESWWGHSRTLHDPLDRLAATLPTTLLVPAADKAATMSGLGHRFGELWGFSKSHARALMGSVPPQDRTAFRLGFEWGATETFGPIDREE